jgi:hypothetical protein
MLRRATLAAKAQPTRSTGSLRGDPARWETEKPKGAMMTNEEFGALEQFPDVRRFRCRDCGSKQFVLADARVTSNVKAHWACECTRATMLPGH